MTNNETTQQKIVKMIETGSGELNLSGELTFSNEKTKGAIMRLLNVVNWSEITKRNEPESTYPGLFVHANAPKQTTEQLSTILITQQHDKRTVDEHEFVVQIETNFDQSPDHTSCVKICDSFEEAITQSIELYEQASCGAL
jgi:hypothetical protein